MGFVKNFTKVITLGGILFLVMLDFLKYRFRKKFNQLNRVEEKILGKVVVITGGSQGMGKASAWEFAKRGATVVIGDVDMKGGIKTVREIQTETGNENVKIFRLDLADMDSVQEFAIKVSKEYPKIKILLNNAGIAPSQDNLYKKTKDGFNMNVAVNYLGHFLLTNLLIPNLQNERKSRIVSVSSTLQMISELDVDDLMMEKSGFGLADGMPYCNTKYCQALFTKQLSKILIGTGIHTYALCPGLVSTNIVRDYRTISSIFWTIILKAIGVSPSEAASNFILYCALEKSIEGESGKMYRFRNHYRAANERLDDNLARKLWEKSAELVKLEERLKN